MREELRGRGAGLACQPRGGEGLSPASSRRERDVWEPRATRVSTGVGGSRGELMGSPPNQRQQPLTPSRPLGFVLGAFFPRYAHVS